MAKGKKSIFFCQNCGHEEAKWLGQCPVCKEWNTFAEEKVSAGLSRGTTAAAKQSKTAEVVPLSQISARDDTRMLTGMKELDRVLGGGIVSGSLVLVGGDPGIGKSTLLLQVCQRLSASRKILYISGEESQTQIKLRANRMGSFTDHMLLLCETNLDTIRTAIERQNPELVIIDSIQTMYNEEVSSAPGSVSQVRESTHVLMQLAKGSGVTIFVIGHVNKEGSIAGPKVLEHMVDCVLYFEGERHMAYRILRAAKNRFGATNEIGVFEMEDGGLAEVPNPSESLLAGRPEDAPGTCVTCVMEGVRPVLAEVQALLAPTSFNVPRRTSNGFDFNRAVLAVLEKRGGLLVSTCDAYINVIGGLSLEEPAADLAMIMALASSFRDKPIPNDLTAIGEVGLTGELRSVSALGQRLSEVRRMGFTKCLIPARSSGTLSVPDGLQLIRVKNIREALAAIL